MQSVVAPSHDLHENPVEVRLQIQNNESIDSLLLELPAAMKPMTLVASRPQQSRFVVTEKEIAINF